MSNPLNENGRGKRRRRKHEEEEPKSRFRETIQEDLGVLCH